MKAIAAVDQNWGIGREGDLLVRLSGDMKRFRSLTTGNVCIMGRKTLESMPGGKPLPNRETWVLTRNESYEAPCRVFHTVEEIVKAARAEEAHRADGLTVYLCGGAEIYTELLPYCEEALLTKIGAAFPADRHFPNLDETYGWEITETSEETEENGIPYRFYTYRNVLPKEQE